MPQREKGGRERDGKGERDGEEERLTELTELLLHKDKVKAQMPVEQPVLEGRGRERGTERNEALVFCCVLRFLRLQGGRTWFSLVQFKLAYVSTTKSTSPLHPVFKCQVFRHCCLKVIYIHWSG